MKRFIVTLLLAIAACMTPIQRAKRDSLPGTIHIVRRGDTLWQIAQQNGAPINELMETNGIASPEALKIGQILFVPEPARGAVKVSPPVKHPQVAQAPIQRPRVAPQAKKRKKEAPDDNKSIALSWPIKNGVILRGFEDNPDRLHEGLSIGAPPKTSVTAAASGEVLYVGDEGTQYGQMVIVKHQDPFVTIYANLEQAFVKQGDSVKPGDKIGTVGLTGGVESPRVHFQVRKHRMAVDPKRYLAGR